MQATTGTLRRWRCKTACCVSVVALCAFGYTATVHGASPSPDAAASVKTTSPIKHIIVLIGENRSFDHYFGVYKPKGAGQTISNILSKGIVNIDGSPGPNFAQATQFSVSMQPAWYLGAPNSAKTAYNTTTNPMPQPNTNFAPRFQQDPNGNFSADFPDAPFISFATIEALGGETDIEPANQVLTTTGSTGITTGGPNNNGNQTLDTRVPGAGTLNGPFPLLGVNISDDDYTGDTTHRYFQAAQQQDCSLANATKTNPTGCLNDLFPFVMDTYDRTSSTVQGNFSEGSSMGFYNAELEEVAVFKQLADRFTLLDNMHQSFLGGTAANHVMLGTADAIFWSDGNGNATTPPGGSTAAEAANPNPKAGTINKYTTDADFANCSDVTQPGILPVVEYLESLPYDAEPNCVEDHFYMVDNVNPGFMPDGTKVPSPATQDSIPPSPVKTIGDSLSAKNITWEYFGGEYNNAVILSQEAKANPAILNSTSGPLAAAAEADPAHSAGGLYCQICNPFQYATSIMTNIPAGSNHPAHLGDTIDLIADIQNNTLPSVSFGKPDGILDGHPSSSKPDLFEAYVQNVLDALEANPTLKETTAVFVTWDEAGGYWDSGFVQMIDFFGDGTRIPLLLLSPYSTGGQVCHSYTDHVSIDKFIERNWGLDPITDRSRDNLPNPTVKASNAYVPTNMPALDDLFTCFNFNKAVNQTFFE
jgi:phospholipase C